MVRFKAEPPVSPPYQVAEAVARGLPALHAPALEFLRTRRPCPVATFLILRSEALSLDVTSEAGASFQRRFNGYYGVRRNADWRAVFYRIFETTKVAPEDRCARFQQALRALYEATGRVEASFVSKLVALLDPGAPIIDSLVRRFLASHGTASPFGGGLVEASAYYTWLDRVFTEASVHEAAAEWSRTFDHAFVDTPGARDLHIAKKLDFLIWAGSSQA